MKHTSSKLTAEEIALDFLEVFQNSYPEKPSWQLIEPFANKIKEYASQSEVTEVSEHDINKNVMQIIEDCCTEIGVNTTSIREGITEYIRSLLSHQTKAETTDRAFDIANEISRLHKLMPDCNLKKHLDLWFSFVSPSVVEQVTQEENEVKAWMDYRNTTHSAQKHRQCVCGKEAKPVSDHDVSFCGKCGNQYHKTK